VTLRYLGALVPEGVASYQGPLLGEVFKGVSNTKIKRWGTGKELFNIRKPYLRVGEGGGKTAGLNSKKKGDLRG